MKLFETGSDVGREEVEVVPTPNLEGEVFPLGAILVVLRPGHQSLYTGRVRPIHWYWKVYISLSQ